MPVIGSIMCRYLGKKVNALYRTYTYHKIEVSFIIVEGGVVPRQHSALEDSVGGGGSRSVHIPSNLKQ